MFRLFAITFWIFFMHFPTARACNCDLLDMHESPKIIEEAFYIGMVRIADVEEVNVRVFKEETRYTFEPLWSYKNPHKDLMIVTKTGVSSCDHEPGKKGDLTEIIIFKRDVGLRFGDLCDHRHPESVWQALREGAGPKSEKLIEIENECKARSGEYIFKDRQGYCQTDELYPASDAGQECKRASECEGICIVEPKSESDKEKIRLSGGGLPAKDFGFENGECSQWRNEKGCFFHYFLQGLDPGSMVTYKCSRPE